MGLNVKVGKGGHGLEVYDEEGKYANEFSFEMGGQQIKGYDDFRSLCFANMAQNSAGQYDAATLENLYNSNPGFKNQVDGQLYDEYNRVLTEAVNEHNAKQVWDKPEDAAKNLHELFVPNLVHNLLENNIYHLLKNNNNIKPGNLNRQTITIEKIFTGILYPTFDKNKLTANKYITEKHIFFIIFFILSPINNMKNIN